MESRRAGPSDIAAVAATLAGAFMADPVWSWVLPDTEAREVQLRAVWTLLLEGGIDYGWVWMTPGAEAATLWIPPGLPELSDAQATRIELLFHELLGPGVGRAETLMDRFEAAHPVAPEHYYLSLFGTRPDCRGRGIGVALLADNLASVDREGRPAYLESTNAANLDRYRSAGFVDRDSFGLSGDGPVVTTMWRDAR